jgi:hypothetical protein
MDGRFSQTAAFRRHSNQSSYSHSPLKTILRATAVQVHIYINKALIHQLILLTLVKQLPKLIESEVHQRVQNMTSVEDITFSYVLMSCIL